MKLKLRIVLALLFMLGVIFYFFVDFIRNDLGTSYIESVEESLIDTANILASFVEISLESQEEGEQGEPILEASKELSGAFDLALQRQFKARIHRLSKSKVDLHVYIVNADGLVVYDSDGSRRVGQNFYNWNDVYLTLNGRYGARLSTSQYKEFLYVAAPIYYEGVIVGALTVVKPKDSINQFIEIAKQKIVTALLIALFLFIFLLIIMSYWITAPIGKLTGYVRALKRKERIRLPYLGNTEIKELGLAFEDLLNELEGKSYIEKYTQTLTHEIKSPLSSIRGAAELLDEEMEADQKQRFYTNIRTEALRIENLVSRLLELSSLESRRELREKERVKFHALASEVIKSSLPKLEQGAITIENRIEEHCSVEGESFLLRHSLSNLLENALKFSPEGGKIIFSSQVDEKSLIISVRDHGEGIPDYATEKIFDRFYSLPPREKPHKKSSGLGLAFVKEALELHGGRVEVKNCPDGGVEARLYFKR